MVHKTKHPHPKPPPPKEQSLLSIMVELDLLQYKCGCSLDKLQIALNHLKAIKQPKDISIQFYL